MTAGFEEDFARWERGEISFDELVERYPDAAHLRLLRDLLASLAEDPVPRPESGWEALRERLPDPRRTARRGVGHWVRRPAMMATAAVLLTAGVVFAVEPFGPGARTIMRRAAAFIAHGVTSLLDVPNPPSAREVLLLGAEDLPMSWVPDVEDEEGDELTCSIVSPPPHGIAEVGSDCLGGSYVPDPDFYGSDSFTYRVRDMEGLSAVAFVNVGLVGVNDPPSAGHDSAVTYEEIPITIHPLTNDVDVEGDSAPTPHSLSGSKPGLGGLSVRSAFGANGSVTIVKDETLTYTPEPDFAGVDSFKYIVWDGSNGFDTGSVSVRVRPVNDAPIADGVSAQGDEDEPFDWAPSVSDVEDDPLTCSIVTPPAHGKATLNPRCSGGSFTPDPDFSGPDSFTYEVTDDTDTSPPATVAITVRSVNDAPIADDLSVQGDEDEPFDWAPSVSDVEDDPLTCSIVTPPAHGKATLNPRCSGGSFTPDPDFSGPDSFTYEVTDDTDTSPPATVAITVRSVNDAPIAGDDTGTTEEGQPIPISILANDADVDGDFLFIDFYTSGSHGTVVSDGAGTLTYSPLPGYIGLDVFTYSVSDGNGGSDSAHVTVTVTPALPPETEGEEQPAPSEPAASVPPRTWRGTLGPRSHALEPSPPYVR